MPPVALRLGNKQRFFKSWLTYVTCGISKYGYHITLLQLFENMKMALGNHEYVATILIDMSKTFDCTTGSF
ncbi:hypothetical protein MAR_003770 [Mya arenaria]|uniref:Uncharacterized protein n=1 Tax=Mya arenaria TaxID=6604 RepID=A0ABY7G6Z7_MYAAR|nr:hypothetical protein MAR_003770 [Mya arenaria]